MSIAHIPYVMCDDCGAPARLPGDVMDNATAARASAKDDGFTRRKWGGRLLDLCRKCTLRRESVTP